MCWGPKFGSWTRYSELRDAGMNMSVYTGAPTKTMMKRWSTLLALQDETFVKIISGSLGIEAFDDFVTQWNEQGGSTIQEEIADELGFDLQQIRKQRDPLFRKNVLRAYNYQCAICGFNMRHDDTTVALEAAHIKWKQHGGPCEIPNGLALCAIHHKAFDKGSIGLDENMRVLVSDAVNGGGIVERLFWDFDGKTIALPQVRKNYPYEVFVEWHRKEVFRG